MTPDADDPQSRKRRVAALFFPGKDEPDPTILDYEIWQRETRMSSAVGSGMLYIPDEDEYGVRGRSITYDGGIISGHISTDSKITLTKGEFVLTKEDVDRIRDGLLESVSVGFSSTSAKSRLS